MSFAINVCISFLFEEELGEFSHAYRAGFAIVARYTAVFTYFEKDEKGQ